MKNYLTILLPVALILLFTELLIQCPETLAKYRTRAEADTAARVAGLSLDVGTPTLLSPDDTLDCGDPSDAVVYEFDLTNHSEVDITYETLLTGLPDWAEAQFENGTGDLDAGSQTRVRLILLSGTEGAPSGTTRFPDLTLSVAAAQKGGY